MSWRKMMVICTTVVAAEMENKFWRQILQDLLILSYKEWRAHEFLPGFDLNNQVDNGTIS